MARREYRKISRSPEEAAKLRELRDKFQKEKPGPDELEAQGHIFVPQTAFLALRNLVAEFREARQRLGLSLRDLAELTGIDQAPLSRLETGKTLNPTFDTLARVAGALGLNLSFTLTPASAPPTGDVLDDGETDRPPNKTRDPFRAKLNRACRDDWRSFGYFGVPMGEPVRDLAAEEMPEVQKGPA